MTATAKQITVFQEIVKEREFQDSKHGADGHSLGAWLLIVESELEEAKHAAVKPGAGRYNIISEIIQVAAVCFAALEQHGVKPLDGRRV